MNNKKMIKFILIFFLIIVNVKTAISQEKRVFNVKLNTIILSEIGEAVFSSSEVVRKDGIEIVESFEVKSGFTRFQHETGMSYPLMLTKKGIKVYYLKESFKDGRYFGVGVDESNSDKKFPVIISSVGIISKMNNYEINNKIITKNIVNVCDDCYKQEFIYNGKSGNVLKFIYREYIGNIARPSFFQNLEYDISENKIVGFKGFRMKVLSTTNVTIEYEVIEPFKNKD